MERKRQLKSCFYYTYYCEEGEDTTYFLVEEVPREWFIGTFIELLLSPAQLRPSL